MKKKLSYLLVAAVLSTAAIAQAQEKKATPPPSREETREQFKNMTPEERAAKMKEWREKQGTGAPEGENDRRRQGFQDASKQLGINPEELRNLTPEQRREKMNAAVDSKLAELKKKKEAKTITAEETTLLERLESRKKQMELHKDNPPRRDGAPGQDKDKEHKDHKEHKDGHPEKPEEKGPEHKGPPEKKDKK